MNNKKYRFCDVQEENVKSKEKKLKNYRRDKDGIFLKKVEEKFRKMNRRENKEIHSYVPSEFTKHILTYSVHILLGMCLVVVQSRNTKNQRGGTSYANSSPSPGDCSNTAGFTQSC